MKPGRSRSDRPVTGKSGTRMPFDAHVAGTTVRTVPGNAYRPVMIVDDDEDLLLNARTILEKHGFEVLTRTSAPDWQELHRTAPSVVFMDINLGPENGIRACQAIKRNPHFDHVPVILLSAMDGDRLADAVGECHADGFLSKPFRTDLLLALAAHYVRGTRRPSFN